MQALILAGGEGTRLRPLTLTRAKPALPLVDRPFIRYLLDWIGCHGIDEALIACGFGAEPVRDALEGQARSTMRLDFLEEPDALGTAGPLRLAADEGLLDERFCVLNGDLLTDLDLGELIRAHEGRGAVATLALYPVDDPSTYGLVRRAGGPEAPGRPPRGSHGEVLGFLEKPDPGQIDTDEINAGAYVIERELLELIPRGRAVSIEREVFPRLVGQGLYGHRLEGYWMDIGTPERYLQASWDILEGAVRTEAGARLNGAGILVEDGAEVDAAATIRPPALVESRAVIAEGATIGSRAVVGPGSDVGRRATISSSVLLEDCSVGSEAEVHEAILAPGVVIGDRVRIGTGTVLGEGSRIEAGAMVPDGTRLAPGEVVA
jgi:mannose-1-phosphate guanylyltransferase